MTPLNSTSNLHLNSNNAYSSTPELNRMNLNNQTPHHYGLQQQQQDQIVAELQRLNLYKPPPPYPGNQSQSHHHQSSAKLASSTSTPDLAGNHHHHHHLHNGNLHNATVAGVVVGGGQHHHNNVVALGGSSPDLVSRKNLGFSHQGVGHQAQEHLHKTFNDLHNINNNSSSSANGGYRNAYSTEEINSVPFRLVNTKIVTLYGTLYNQLRITGWIEKI